MILVQLEIKCRCIFPDNLGLTVKDCSGSENPVSHRTGRSQYEPSSGRKEGESHPRLRLPWWTAIWMMDDAAQFTLTSEVS